MPSSTFISAGYISLTSKRFAVPRWLPDMDSNHDWVSQSHLCYHYTIGQ
jgi:hypothetical protein